MNIDVVVDASDADPGFVGERLVEVHGGVLRFRDRDLVGSGATTEADLLLLLGSARSVWDAGETATVAAEAALILTALHSGVPVIGICYGAQVLAHALGGSVSPMSEPEIGWYQHVSEDPVLCPPGPWTQCHSDMIVAPPGARTLGSSTTGCQGFATDDHRARSIGWQFHPEVTPERFSIWVEQERALCERHGIDSDRLLEEAPARGSALRSAAHTLTDAALVWLSAPRPGVGPVDRRFDH